MNNLLKYSKKALFKSSMKETKQKEKKELLFII